MSEAEPLAFVLMPFDPRFAPIYEQLIRPALEEAGYEVQRADSFTDQQNILRDIVQGLVAAKLIVADLTTLNANVLYELGLAHGIGAPTVLLAQSMDDVPFDLRSYRVIVYSTEFDQVAALKKGLGDVAERHLQDAVTFGSPLTDFGPKEAAEQLSRGRANESMESSSELEVEDGDDEDEEGFLDLLVRGTDAADEITKFFESFNAAVNEVTEKFNAKAVEVQAAAAASDAGAPRRMLVLAHAISMDVEAFVARVGDLLPGFENDLETVVSSFDRWIAGLEVTTAEDRVALEASRVTMAELRETTTENLRAARETREIAQQFGVGTSKELARAGRRMAAVLDRYLASVERLESFAVRSVAVFDELLATDGTTPAA